MKRLFILAMLLAPLAHAGTISLAWDATPGATAYRIHYGTAPGVYTLTFDAGDP